MNITVSSIALVHGRAFVEAAIQDTCALLPVICADFSRRQVKCAHFSRFECLLPRAA